MLRRWRVLAGAGFVLALSALAISGLRLGNAARARRSDAPSATPSPAVPVQLDSPPITTPHTQRAPGPVRETAGGRAPRPRLAGLPGGAFEGRVVSAATGRGVGGAQLTFSRAGEATEVTAGLDGSFRFEPSLPGRWTLAAAAAPDHLPFAPEWGYSTVLLDARPGVTIHDVVVLLAPAVEYRGLVVDPDGRPAEGATVRVLGAAAGERALMPARDVFVADAAGEFRFVAGDDAVLEARHPAFATTRQRLDFAARVNRRITLVLGPHGAPPEPPRAIRGTVALAGDEPAVGSLVSAWPEREGPRGGGQAVSDAEGRFAIEGLAPGSYRVIASQPGSGEAVAREVEAGTEGVRLELWEGGRLVGSVRDRRTDAPVATFRVAVRPRGHGWRGVRGLTVVDPVGRYEVDGVAPGASWVMVAAPGYAPSEEVAVTVSPPGEPATTADFDLAAGGRIQGRVVDRGAQSPIAGAVVEAMDGAAMEASALSVHASAVAGEDGAFEITGVPDRPLSLYAFAPGHHARVVPGLEVPEGGSSGPFVIELTPVAAGAQPWVELGAIGAALSPRGDALAVMSVTPGGSAAEAGLGPGDELTSIDGRSVGALSFDSAVSLIGSTGDKPLSLGVLRAGGRGRDEELLVVHRDGSGG